jgi:murein DD-endopeptidase MepM/ murein hydrolase activator NlpD
MADRRWTLIVVPHGSDSPRTFTVTERVLRTVATVVGVCALAAMVGVGTLASRAFWAPTARGMGAAAMGGSEVAEITEGIRRLRDTIAIIRSREDRIRLLAGLPSSDSTATSPAAVDSSLSTTSLRSDVNSLLERAGHLSARFAEVSDSLAQNEQRLASLPSIMPTAGWLTSQFSRNRRHPVLHVSRPHEGIDVSTAMGTPIVAPAAGRVKSAGNESGYGLTVEIDHGNGIVTKYAHCSRILVRPGQQVTRGMTIAAVGKSGLSTGPHLHYEIHVNGRVVDPLTFVLPDAIPD